MHSHPGENYLSHPETVLSINQHRALAAKFFLPASPIPYGIHLPLPCYFSRLRSEPAPFDAQRLDGARLAAVEEDILIEIWIMTDAIGHVPMLTSALSVFMHTAGVHVLGNTSIQTVKIDGPLFDGACLPKLSLELSEIENGSRSLIDCSSNGWLRWKKITPSSKEATHTGCPRKTNLLGKEQPKTPQSHLFKPNTHLSLFIKWSRFRSRAGKIAREREKDAARNGKGRRENFAADARCRLIDRTVSRCDK